MMSIKFLSILRAIEGANANVDGRYTNYKASFVSVVFLHFCEGFIFASMLKYVYNRNFSQHLISQINY